jgi:formyltetrahydrofolate synthetase
MANDFEKDNKQEMPLPNIIGIEEYERVFEAYLEICNQAIDKNKVKFPYSEIWSTRWKKLGKDNILQCAVYDDRPKVIYSLQLTEDMKIKIIKKEHTVAAEAWPFKYTYLKHVVDNPDDYINHPANLDWGWLEEIFG